MESLPDLRERPVTFLSVYGGAQHVAKALELGADDCIVKPFSPTELISRVKTVLRPSANASPGGKRSSLKGHRSHRVSRQVRSAGPSSRRPRVVLVVTRATVGRIRGLLHCQRVVR